MDLDVYSVRVKSHACWTVILDSLGGHGLNDLSQSDGRRVGRDGAPRASVVNIPCAKCTYTCIKIYGKRDTMYFYVNHQQTRF